MRAGAHWKHAGSQRASGAGNESKCRRFVRFLLIRNPSLNSEREKHIYIEEIATAAIDGNLRSGIRGVSDIIDEAAYGRMRLSPDTFLETVKIPLETDMPLGMLQHLLKSHML